MNKLIVDLLAKVKNFEFTLLPFLNIETNEFTVNGSKKLAIILMQKFNKEFDNFKKLEPTELCQVVDKFTSAKWMFGETYQKVFDSFSTNFNHFTPNELAHMTTCL